MSTDEYWIHLEARGQASQVMQFIKKKKKGQFLKAKSRVEKVCEIESGEDREYTAQK